MNDSSNFDATYSAEDNKLRLYSVHRFDDETLREVKAMGFRWAPKQDLFVAPAWTPEREDFLIELAGEITAEQTTMAERAEAKAERLAALAEKRAAEARGFHAAANAIASRFEFGQPILVGHHSERKARKDQERLQNAMDKAVKAQSSVSYWNYRARGVECHAEQKNSDRTRANRIKRLLAELRGLQRTLNNAHKNVALWAKIIDAERTEKWAENVAYLAGWTGGDEAKAPSGVWQELDAGDITAEDAATRCLEHFERVAAYPGLQRWIVHTLNRLAYETEMAGGVARFEGELTPVILQAFARAQGADKPKATKTPNGYRVASAAPLPVHLGEGKELELSGDEWRDLMQSVGHAVVVKERRASSRPAAAPLINPTKEQAEKLQALWNVDQQKQKFGQPSEINPMTQADYSRRSKGEYSLCNTISLDEKGRRIWKRLSKTEPAVVCRVRISGGGRLYSADSVVIVEDKPAKDLPFDLDALLTEAQSKAVEEGAA